LVTIAEHAVPHSSDSALAGHHSHPAAALCAIPAVAAEDRRLVLLDQSQLLSVRQG
jgi:hypothetical protein